MRLLQLSASDITIRPANGTDQSAIESRLKECLLPANDLEKYLGHFVVAEKDTEILGCAGLEPYRPYALFRSLAVKEDCRGAGIAGLLVSALIEYARTLEIKRAFVLTTTAESYLLKKGFQPMKNETAPDEVKRSGQFQGVCPAGAVLLYIDL